MNFWILFTLILTKNLKTVKAHSLRYPCPLVYSYCLCLCQNSWRKNAPRTNWMEWYWCDVSRSYGLENSKSCFQNAFTNIVSTKDKRTKFIGKVIEYLRLHGLDLDWEYPGKNGSPAGDKTKFAQLWEEMKAASFMSVYMLWYINTRYSVSESSPVMDSRMASCRPTFWKSKNIVRALSRGVLI